MRQIIKRRKGVDIDVLFMADDFVLPTDGARRLARPVYKSPVRAGESVVIAKDKEATA